MNDKITLTDKEIMALRDAFKFCHDNNHYNKDLQRAMDKVFTSQKYSKKKS